VVGHDLDDGGIAERFGLDAVRHADAPDWCRGVCRDGPMVGTVVYAVNRIGTTVLIALPPRPDGMAIEYKVTQVSTDAGPADLRLSQS